MLKSTLRFQTCRTAVAATERNSGIPWLAENKSAPVCLSCFRHLLFNGFLHGKKQGNRKDQRRKNKLISAKDQ